MRQIAAVAVGLLLSALPAQAGPLREAAERAALAEATTAILEVSAEQGQPSARRRSIARTWGGVGLIAGGLLLVRQKCDGIRLGNRCVGQRDVARRVHHDRGGRHDRRRAAGHGVCGCAGRHNAVTLT